VCPGTPPLAPIVSDSRIALDQEGANAMSSSVF
jgi:hypothetical protein